jgi:hypothetical protein
MHKTPLEGGCGWHIKEGEQYMASGFSVMNGRQNTCVAMRFKEERSHQLYKEASDELGLCAQNVQNLRHFVNFLKEGWNCGCDPSLTKLFIKSSLAHCASEPILKVGCKFWNLLFPPLQL